MGPSFVAEAIQNTRIRYAETLSILRSHSRLILQIILWGQVCRLPFGHFLSGIKIGQLVSTPIAHKGLLNYHKVGEIAPKVKSNRQFGTMTPRRGNAATKTQWKTRITP